MRKNVLPKSEVRFLENGHSYFLGIDELVGVTTILRKVLFPTQYAGIDADVLERAAKRGTEIHNLVQAYEMGAEIDRDMYEDDRYTALDEWSVYRPVDLTFIDKEYLVSDNEKVASMIDLVFTNTKGKYVLCDIKTTSECNKEYLAWQLSFYAWMFEKQTGKKVASLLGAWWDKSRWHFFELQRKSDEEVQKVIDAYFAGTAVQAQSVPAPLIQLGQIYGNILQAYKTAEAEKKEFDGKMLSAMEEHNIESFETDDIKVTRIAPSVGVGFDVDAFKAEYPDLYKRFMTKETTRKSAIRVTLRKKD